MGRAGAGAGAGPEHEQDQEQKQEPEQEQEQEQEGGGEGGIGGGEGGGEGGGRGGSRGRRGEGAGGGGHWWMRRRRRRRRRTGIGLENVKYQNGGAIYKQLINKFWFHCIYTRPRFQSSYIPYYIFCIQRFSCSCFLFFCFRRKFPLSNIFSQFGSIVQ